MNSPSSICGRIAILSALFLLLLCHRPWHAAQAQTAGGASVWRIMEYNVENLFDTLHTAPFADEEFTPQGSHQWDTRRYWAKLSRLSRVIAAASADLPPACVALVEVENDSVVSHLIRRTRLWRMGYRSIVTHSRDVRGINVALLFQPALFRPVSHDSLRVPPTDESLSFTRDVLHVAGQLQSGDTLDLWVCHWPSRRNGARSERYRNRMAARLRAHVDRVLLSRRHPMAIVTGDFNAFWPEPSISVHLGARLPEPSPQSRQLYLLSHAMQASGGISGTYKFQGEWNQLDNFLVSGTLLSASPSLDSASPSLDSASPFLDSASPSLDSASPYVESPFRTSAARCRIVDFPFLLQGLGSEAGPRPFRTYLGPHYQGGFSDHLPLVLDFLAE